MSIYTIGTMEKPAILSVSCDVHTAFTCIARHMDILPGMKQNTLTEHGVVATYYFNGMLLCSTQPGLNLASLLTA